MRSLGPEALCAGVFQIQLPRCDVLPGHGQHEEH